MNAVVYLLLTVVIKVGLGKNAKLYNLYIFVKFYIIKILGNKNMCLRGIVSPFERFFGIHILSF